MDMSLAELAPVSLVVKAPNQRYEDQVVEANLGWTIRKLKEHLSNVYPTKPEENQQRLIYSGQLLKDHLVLKDVLREYEEKPQTHTVHLVCSHDGSSTSDITTTPSSSRETSSTSVNAEDGLRRRTTPIASTSAVAPPPSQPPAVAPHQSTYTQAYSGLNPAYYAAAYPGYGGQSAPPAQYPQMAQYPHPAQMAQYPHMAQYAYMQQMYAQQMAQYMQYYQQVPAPPAATPAPTEQAPPAGRPPPQDEPVQVMNAGAGGGVMMNQGGEGPRDWLDVLYTVTRFVVILSIVYFNSTLSRFIVVLSVSLLFYMYQFVFAHVMFRRQPAAPAAAAPPAAAQPPVAQQDLDQGPGVDENAAEEAPTDQEPAAPEPPAVPRISTLHIIWSFITTFFSSLIPVQPPPVNAN